MQNYKDLKVWVAAHQFTLNVYSMTKLFPKEEMFGLTTQLRRAAASVGANIAEGCGRIRRRTWPGFYKLVWVRLMKANISCYLRTI